MSGECDQCGNTLCVCHMPIAELVTKEEYDAVNSDLQAARAEVERLKAQDLTHAVIASDIKLREERDALAAKLRVAKKTLEFSLEGLAMWRKFQSPGNIAEVEERIRQALAEIELTT